jgi:hypothetical protein
MATLSTDIRDAWQAAVWSSQTVADTAANVYLFDISPESDFDMSKIYADGAINFFLCKTARKSEPLIAGQVRYTFQVVVEYYLQQTAAAESTYNTLADRLEAVDDLVLTALGATWSATVDYYQGGQPLAVASVTIDQRKCWKGGYTYTAFKTS